MFKKTSLSCPGNLFHGGSWHKVSGAHIKIMAKPQPSPIHLVLVDIFHFFLVTFCNRLQQWYITIPSSYRGKEMSLSRSIGSYYKLPKSDPNAVYLLPTAIYLLQCCFIAANIVWAGQCDNSLFPWKLCKINFTAQQTINTAIKN